jgi:hypothetical protein
MKKFKFVLGAADVEMAAIESLLAACGQQFVHATVGGRRCHAANAYNAENKDMDGLDVVFVECRVLDVRPVHVIDHHKPGDSGYDKAPEEFMNASSLGQVYAFLASHGLLDPESAGMDHAGTYTVANMGHRAPTVFFIPENHVYVAAADHCLEAAYRGKCPGVEPEKLLELRSQWIAEFQKTTAASVKENIREAVEKLKNAKKVVLGGVEVADLADGNVIPQLPEAGAYAGIPFVALVPSPDGRKKYVLQAAPPAAIEAFLAGAFAPLYDYYGAPARGFAGGYDRPLN